MEKFSHFDSLLRSNLMAAGLACPTPDIARPLAGEL